MAYFIVSCLTFYYYQSQITQTKMTQEFVHMNWNQFTESAKGAFKNLWKSGDFTDVTLACADGEQVKAHKVILSSCSPVLRNILLNNSHQHPLIYMKGFEMEYIKSLLQFVYTGEVEIENEILAMFLKIADELQISGLTKIIDLKQNQEDHSLQKGTSARKKNLEKINTVSGNIDGQLVVNLRKCKKCQKEFTTKANLKAHMLSIHESAMHLCSHCPYKSGFKHNLRKHVQKRHNTTILAPLELSPVLKTEDIEISKTETEISETETQISLTDNVPNSSGHFCDHCSIEVKSGKALMKHRNEEHPGLGFYCS